MKVWTVFFYFDYTDQHEELNMNSDIQSEFTDLIKPHKSALFNTAYRLTRNQIYAEDLIQDTYYKAFRALNQYQRNTNFRAWIFRILVNTYITGYRKADNVPQWRCHINNAFFFGKDDNDCPYCAPPLKVKRNRRTKAQIQASKPKAAA